MEKLMTPLETAIEIAVRAHAGQVDKAGAPYILHPLRMMLRMSSPTEMMAAVLHDVVEDGPGWTPDRLKEEGIPADVIEAVAQVTKRDEEDYETFVLRAASHPIARRVKLVVLGAGLWVLSPVDLIPEFLPVIGPLDDVVVVALALRYAARRIPREALQEAWPAEPRILDRLIGDRKARRQVMW